MILTDLLHSESSSEMKFFMAACRMSERLRQSSLSSAFEVDVDDDSKETMSIARKQKEKRCDDDEVAKRVVMVISR